MAVKEALCFEVVTAYELATCRTLNPYAYDSLGTSDEASNARKTGAAKDTLTAHDRLQSMKPKAADTLLVYDVAFQGKFGNAVDALASYDYAENQAKWKRVEDVLIIDDDAEGMAAKSARDQLYPVEYLVADLRTVKRAVDLLRAVDAAMVVGSACTRSDVMDFILTYAPYGPNGPQQTVILPGPLAGDTAKVDISRIVRRSRGNDLVLSSPYGYRTPSQIVVFNLEEALKEQLANFIEYSTGQKIYWRDHHGYSHYGIIGDPSTPFTEAKDGMWRVQLELIETGP